LGCIGLTIGFGIPYWSSLSQSSREQTHPARNRNCLKFLRISYRTTSMSSSQQQTLDVPDISGLSLSGSKPASASSTPSIFTLLSRATYVPPPTSLTSRTLKSSSVSPGNHLGSAVDPLLKHLEEPKGKENGQQAKGSADDILQKLSFLPTIGSPNQYFTTVSSWDDR